MAWKPIPPSRRPDGRGSAASRGYGARHRKWRKLVLARHPVCRGWPIGSGCGDLATIADHIVSLRSGGNWSLENGNGMCARCHNKKTMSESRRGYGPKSLGV